MGDHKRRKMRLEEFERILKGHSSEIRGVVDDLTKMLVDDGRIIEAGWVAFRIATIPDDAPAAQIDATRIAFFAGAQHLFGSMMAMLDPGAEPTERDERRMDSIHLELGRFIAEFKLRHFQAEGSA